MDIKNIKKSTKNLTILYIEKDINDYQYILETLDTYFKDIVHVKSAEEALKRYEKSPYDYDIVLTELSIPNMPGIEMIEKILEKNPHQSIIVLSDCKEFEVIKELLNLGINSFLSKPIDKDDIISTLFAIAKKIQLKNSEALHYKNIEKTNQLLEKKLEYSRKTNLTTGIKNRVALVEDIDTSNYTMLAFVDIDHIDFINNLYGSDIANIVINKFASLLKNIVNESNFFLYQIAGDQFAICSNDQDATEFKDFIKKLSQRLTNLQLYIEEIDEEISIDATIGVTYELNEMAALGMMYESNLLLVQADSALKYAKQHKKALVSYDESMNTLQDIQNIIYWKDVVKNALNNDNIIPVYQPIVDKEGNILKYETLMRLKSSESEKGDLISPFFFLDIAIQTKQYAKLSLAILTKAFKKLKETDVTLSVNITFSDLENKKVWDLFEKNLNESDIGKRLIIEIVESEDIKSYKLLEDFISLVKPFGVRLAIDDFGSGFSNFEYVMKIKPDYLKIDGSLVKNIDNDLGSFAIVKAITQFAHTLDIKVIAEYVHSDSVLKVLKELGVDEYQGFYFYEPALDVIT